jgi:hypothetical protein
MIDKDPDGVNNISHRARCRSAWEDSGKTCFKAYMPSAHGGTAITASPRHLSRYESDTQSQSMFTRGLAQVPALGDGPS